MSRKRTGGGCSSADRALPNRRSKKDEVVRKRSSKTSSGGVARLSDSQYFREPQSNQYERGGPTAGRGALPKTFFHIKYPPPTAINSDNSDFSIYSKEISENSNHGLSRHRHSRLRNNLRRKSSSLKGQGNFE